jgi:phytoene dehydrogenase-like protein
MQQEMYDVVVVGSGPNGLAAAIFLQEKGLRVLVVEGKDTIGGGMRTMEVTLPDFHHDICSAIHPLAVSAPYLKSLPLEQYGLEYLHPRVLAAHPLENGQTGVLYRSLEETAEGLGKDAAQYRQIMRPIIEHWEGLSGDFLGPLTFPKKPLQLAAFGIKALQPAAWFARKFKEEKTKALWAGMVAHGIQPFSNWATSAIGLVLMAAGHYGGWPVARGGSQRLASALGAYFESLGGEIWTGLMVKYKKDIPEAKATLFNLGPKQILEIMGQDFSPLYRRQLANFRYGMGVYKMDFALDGPIPWKSKEAGEAGTVHLGGSIDEISHAESIIWKGKYTENPYVLIAQQSLVDDSRAPAGKHTAWAYCHVPAGSTKDMSGIIENQIEKSAPGFKDLILAKYRMNALEVQAYNPNYIGGDINGGVQDITQLFTRPALRWSPYKTAAKGYYICSSSTPPGGGVHGMCGYHAAQRVWKDMFASKK